MTTPVFRAVVPAPYRVGVTFRVGMADEPPPLRGVTHVVEHLALASLGRRDHEINGGVGPTFTTFFAEGSADDVSRFVNDLGSALADLPVDRLEVERSVLLTEESQRPPDPVSELFLRRWGPCAYGGVAIGELGLHHLDGAAVRGWAAAWFTDGNVALWIGGPDPSLVTCELALPEGPRRSAPPVPDPVESLPGWIPSRLDGVHIGMVTPRHAGMSLALEVIEDRLRDRLRHQEGLSYGVYSDYEALTADVAHVTVSADCRPEHAQHVCELVLAEIDALAATGPSEEELARVRRRHDIDDAMRPLGVACNDAENLLVGADFGDEAEQEAILQGLTAEDVRVAAEGAWASAFALVPFGHEVTHRRFSVVSRWSESATDGWTIRPAALVRLRRPRWRLIMGRDAISITTGRKGEAITIRYDDCVAVVQDPSGELYLLSADGFEIPIVPGAWADPEDLLAELRYQVPADRWVALRPAPVAVGGPHATRSEAGRLPRLASAGPWVLLALCAVAAIAGAAAGRIPIIPVAVGSVLGIRAIFEQRGP